MIEKIRSMVSAFMRPRLIMIFFYLFCAFSFVLWSRSSWGASGAAAQDSTVRENGPSKAKVGVSGLSRGFSPGEIQIMMDEVEDLRRQYASLEGKKGVDAGSLMVFRERINEIEMRLKEWATESKYRDSQTEDLKHFTSETLELATTWIHWVAVLFAGVVLAIGLGNFLESRQLKKEIEKERADVKLDVGVAKKEFRDDLVGLKEEVRAARVELERDRLELRDEIRSSLGEVKAARDQGTQEVAGFKMAVEEERISSEQTRVFVQAVAERFFSDALLELLSALRKVGVLEDADDERLRNKAKEIEARLFLLYPDPERAHQAIRTLMGLGSDDALPDLSRFISEAKSTPDLRDLAMQAIVRISERRGAARTGNATASS